MRTSIISLRLNLLKEENMFIRFGMNLFFLFVLLGALSVPMHADLLTLGAANLGEMWHSTIPPRSRNIIHTLTHNEFDKDKSSIGFTPFAFITRHETKVFNDILNMTTFIEALEDDADTAEVARVLPRELSKLSLWEEQLGFMAHGSFYYNGMGVRVDVPVYAVTSHPYAYRSTVDRIDLLSNALSSTEFTPEQEKAIADKLTGISREIGFGDIKVGVSFSEKLSKKMNLRLTAGIQGIIPARNTQTARKQLSFNPSADNFNPIPFDLVLGGYGSLSAEEALFKYATRLIDTIRAVATPTVLGDRAFGFGGYVSLLSNISTNLTAKVLLEGFYLRPMLEYRIIPRFRHDDPSQLAVEPGEFLVKVTKGLVLRGIGGFEWKMSNKSKIGLGFEVFGQNKEHIHRAFTEAENPDNIVLMKAEMDRALQTSLQIYYKRGFEFKKCDGSIVIRGSGTINSSNIGRSLLLGITAGLNF